MTLIMVHRLKKTCITVPLSQKYVRNATLQFYVMELREKWMSYYDVNWRRITNKCRNCHTSVCFKV